MCDSYDHVVMVKTMMIAVLFDLYVGDSTDDDDRGGGSSVALKLYETGECRINDFITGVGKARLIKQSL